MRTSVALFVGLLVAFLIGAGSGYAAKSVTSPAPGARPAVAACPQGTHAEVWYTAKTWACEAASR
jgi:hypothetical protein